MHIPNLLKLADVLDSGEYTQCRGRHVAGPSCVCVDGLAAILSGCKITSVLNHGQSFWYLPGTPTTSSEAFIGNYAARRLLMNANDSGKTFPELAAMIREMVAKEAKQ